MPVLVATLIACAFAGQASAATVHVERPDCGIFGLCVEIRYRASAGEVNHVTVEPVGGLRMLVADTAPLTPGAGCVSAGPTAAVCTWESNTCQYYECSRQPLIDLSLGDGADSVRSELADFENVMRVDAGPGDDVVAASHLAWAKGGPGNDSLSLTVKNPLGGPTGELSGGDGDDVLVAVGPGGNNVLLDGGAGADRLDGGVADYSVRTEPVSVTPDGVANDGAAGEGDDIGGKIRGIHGGSGDDRLVAGSAGISIRGHAGDDDIRGGPEGDNILPGDGADTVAAGGGDDSITAYEDADTVDHVDCGEDFDRADADFGDRMESCEYGWREPLNELVPPSSRVTSAPATATMTPITIEFTASDPAPSSGLAWVTLYVKEPGATTYAAVAGASPDAGRIAWSPTSDGTHAMYTVAVDQKGNREAAPAEPDASTRVDLIAPRVTGHSPAGTSVNAAAKVTVTFSEEMDRAATQQAFRLLRPDGTAVAGAFSWSGTTMTFAPSPKFARKTRYEARVGTAAKDVAGRPLESEHVWTFQTS